MRDFSELTLYGLLHARGRACTSVVLDALVFVVVVVAAVKAFFNFCLLPQLTYNIDTEAHYRERDQSVCATLSRSGIDVVSKVGHTLYDIDE